MKTMNRYINNIYLNKIIECPKCGENQIDNDGLGFILCDKCNHCIHPSLYNGSCGICGEKITKEILKCDDNLI